MTLRDYIAYMRDALNRFQAHCERKGILEERFTSWCRRFHDFVRAEHPKTIEVKPATNDPEEFKANLPTRPRGTRRS
jgi:hypothetical protein